MQMYDCRKCINLDSCPYGKTGHEKGTSIGFSAGECKEIMLPLISLRGYALKPEEVSRMRENAEKELREIRKELGYGD